MGDVGRSGTSRQTYSRWFTVWPATHVNAGKSVEVMPVAEHEAEVKRLRTALEQIASVRGPLIEADPATLGAGYEQIAKEALDG